MLGLAISSWQAQAQIYDTNNDVVQTFAGFGIPGYIDGQGQLTAFSSPAQIVSDTASNLYVWDSGNSRIRKITPNGTVSTFAGGGAYLEGYGTNVSLAWGTAGTLAHDGGGAHLEHNPGRPISWVGTGTVIVGFIIGGIAFFPSPNWVVFWIGTAVAIIGCLILLFSKTFSEDWY